MSRISLRVGLATLAAFGGLASMAPAQGFGPAAAGFNPYAAMAQPGMAGRGMNLAAYQQGIAGFNPYTPGGVGSNPYTAGGMDSMTGSNPYSPYGGYGAPFVGDNGIYGRYGSTLFGAAEFLRGASTALTSQEQARLMRQQYEQARLQTIKQRFDLEMYIRANTPTFTEEQAKVARQTLKRLQTAANPAEISTGRAHNFLLDDMSKAANRAVPDDAKKIELSEGVLSHINVRRPNSPGSLGLLRNDGKLNFPPALDLLLTPQEKTLMKSRAQKLVADAANGKLDANSLKDFAQEIDHALDKLTAKANDIATPQYLEAKRFLHDLNDARLAIEGGQVPVQLSFQKFIGGGKKMGEVVNFMVENGLVFAPATQADEAAYRALYSALVAYNVGFNTMTASAETKD